MALRRYDYYPSSPRAIREAAAAVRGGTSNLHRLLGQVDRQHRSVVASVQGDLVSPLEQSVTGPYRLASSVTRRALWAAAQLETFADAIEVYNRESTDPWSIERLNQKADQGAAAYFCLAVPGPDASARDEAAYRDLLAGKERELQSILDAHFARLEAQLDEAAREAAAALRREPSEADVIAMWKAGNLPVYAALAWPELNLRGIAITGVDAGLLDLTPDEVLARLRDPATPLSDAELEWLAVSHPDLMRRFHDEWKLENTVLLPPGEAPAGYSPDAAEGGWILGPDGRWYPIQIPEPGPVPPGTGPVVSALPGGLYDTNGNWVTVDQRQGRLYLGEEPPTGLLILSGMTGFTPNIYGNLSVGENQTDYLTYDEHGDVVAHQQATERGPAWSPPPSIPEPADPAGSGNPRLDRLDRVSSLVDIGVGGLEGLQLSNQIDADNSYAGNVVFQVSGDERRAVIQAAQLTYDPDTGKVVEHPYRRYATAADVNQERTGDLEEHPATRPTPTPTPTPSASEPTEPGPRPGPSPVPRR